MQVLWIQFDSRLPGSLLDYPASLPRETLGAMLAQNGITLRVVSPGQACELARFRPQVLLFSATTPEWPMAVDVAARIRNISPDSVLIAGGYHISALPEDEGTNLFDYVVVGEGERSLCSIFESGSFTPGSVPASFRPKIVRSPRISNLDALPIPLRNSEDVKRHRLRGLMYPNPSRQTGVVALLLSRGCNNHCSFCASHTMWGSHLVTRRVSSAIDEVKHLTEECEVNTMVFVDQAFGEDVAWTKYLCHAVEDTCEKPFGWYCMAKTTIDQSLLPVMAAAGCTKIGFGVETADQEVRRRLKHHDGGDVDDLNSLFRACNKLGIFVKAYCIIGFPWETWEYLWGTTMRFLERLEANELKISFFTPFPGTPDWQKYSNQLATTDWRYFDTEAMPVVRNPNISAEQYHQIREGLFHAFYGSNTFADGVQRMTSDFPRYVESYREFCCYLSAHGMITGEEEWLGWIGGQPVRRPLISLAGTGS